MWLKELGESGSKWVRGENGSKSIRGKEMEESGSEKAQMRESAMENMGDRELLGAYLGEQKALGARRAAIVSTKSKLERLLGFLDEHDHGLLDLSYEVASEYQRSLLEYRMARGDPYRPNTIISLMGQASSFATWLTRNNLILCNPFKRLRRPRQEKRLPRNLPDEERLGGFLKSLSRFDEEDGFRRRLRRYRTHLLAEFIYACGLRIAEAAALRVSDLDLESMRLVVGEPKGGRVRIALLGTYAAGLLRIYIRKIRPLLIALDGRRDASRLFLCSHNTLRRKFNEDLKKASIGDYPSPCSHDLRHALGYHLLRAGCPLRYIQQILGHAHIGTSELYTKVDGQGLSRMLESCHPRVTNPRVTNPRVTNPGATSPKGRHDG